MATVADLDAQVAAAVEALPTAPVRLHSDYNVDSGEIIPRDAHRYRLRMDATEKINIGSNRYRTSVQVALDMLVRMSPAPPLPPQGRAYSGPLWTDQETLIDRSFWESLAAVVELVPDSSAQVVEELTRSGDVLIYQVAVDVVLAP